MSLYEKRSDAERAGQPYEEPGIQDAAQPGPARLSASGRDHATTARRQGKGSIAADPGARARDG